MLLNSLLVEFILFVFENGCSDLFSHHSKTVVVVELNQNLNRIFFQTVEIGKLGVLLRTPKSFANQDGPLLPILHGPGRGADLSKIEAVTAKIIGRKASKLLWTN